MAPQRVVLLLVSRGGTRDACLPRRYVPDHRYLTRPPAHRLTMAVRPRLASDTKVRTYDASVERPLKRPPYDASVENGPKTLRRQIGRFYDPN
jgi:hypothetical protein